MRKRDNVMALISAFCFGAIFTAFILAIARYGSNWPSVTFLWDIAQFRITRIRKRRLAFWPVSTRCEVGFAWRRHSWLAISSLRGSGPSLWP